jgi:hypothetical protein
MFPMLRSWSGSFDEQEALAGRALLVIPAHMAHLAHTYYHEVAVCDDKRAFFAVSKS